MFQWNNSILLGSINLGKPIFLDYCSSNRLYINYRLSLSCAHGGIIQEVSNDGLVTI